MIKTDTAGSADSKNAGAVVQKSSAQSLCDALKERDVKQITAILEGSDGKAAVKAANGEGLALVALAVSRLLILR